jgi:exodeoxyribonuclease VII large subunit
MDENSISLLDLNRLVRLSLEQNLSGEYWIVAELSEVHENYGNCYVEFIQNDKDSSKCLAKARGIIWQRVYAYLKPYFETNTKQTFTKGISVRVLVTVTFHEIYGYSLNVLQIDPAFTLGEMALKRQQIIQQLKDDGIFDLNKELELPLLPQRVAVISSSTAAGYGDFCDQLLKNDRHFYFSMELFPAIMQGPMTEQSVLSAMQAVDSRIDEFDVLVIIRGGGSTSDLSCFDNYILAAAVAQFRLPVITGIGHERDDSVLDMVAHTREKTPTAVAAFLVARVGESADYLSTLTDKLHNIVQLRLQEIRSAFQELCTSLPALVIQKIGDCRSKLMLLRQQMSSSVQTYLNTEHHRMELMSSKIDAASPEKILAKGYSMTTCNGKTVKNASELKEGMMIETKFYKGSIVSEVKKKEK